MQTHSPKRWNWRRRADISRISSRLALYSWCPLVSHYPRSEPLGISAAALLSLYCYCYYNALNPSRCWTRTMYCACIVLARSIQTCAQSRCTPPRFCTAPVMSRARRAEVPVLLCIGGVWVGVSHGVRERTLHPAALLVMDTVTWDSYMSKQRQAPIAPVRERRSCRPDESAWVVQRVAICLQCSAAAAARV